MLLSVHTKTQVKVFSLEISDQHPSEPQITLEGTGENQDGDIFTTKNRTQHIKFLLAEAHKFLEKLDTKVNGQPQTFPVFLVSSNRAGEYTELFSQIVEAVNKVYYTDGSRFAIRPEDIHMMEPKLNIDGQPDDSEATMENKGKAMITDKFVLSTSCRFTPPKPLAICIAAKSRSD